MSFWGELKRRNVFKVGAAYLIAAWLILQVASITFPALNLPSWALPLVTVLLIIGFIIAIILAWAYEVTPDGVKLTKKVPLTDSITHVTGRRLNYVLAGLIIVLVGYIVILQFFIGKPPVQTEMTSTVAEQSTPAPEVKEAPKTIAVLPFADMSPDKDQEYFVDGLSEEILNSIAKIPNLLVTARTSSFAFKDTGKTVEEIAEVLGVAHILEGSVRKAGDALRITVQLIRASDGFHLWSETYNRELKDIFTVQENIATAVANELKITLGIGKSFNQLGSTENVEAYELYLVALGQTTENERTRALESLDAVIALDPNYALAWALKANIHSGNSMKIPYGLVTAELDAQFHAAQTAVNLEPNLPEAIIALGHTKTVIHDWVEAELDYRKAIELKAEQTSEHFDTQTMLSLSMHYEAVANFKEANAILNEMRRSDPLNPSVHARYIWTSGILGDMQEAKNEDERCRALFGERWNHYTWAITLLRLGVDDSLSRDEILSSELIWSVAKTHIESPEEGLFELRRCYSEDVDLSLANLLDISQWTAYFGDTEFSLDIIKRAAGFQAVSVLTFWSPVMHEVRQLPRFKEYVREIGLVDYWEQFGWPDICHKLENGDFVCD